MNGNERVDYYEAEEVPNNDQNDAQAFINSYNESIETFNKSVDLIRYGMDVWRESEQITRDIAKINGITKVKLADIAAKYSICQEMLMAEYGQRDKALGKHYELLDKAIESNDRELVVAALKGISTIVTTSPADSFEKFLKSWNDNSKPLELDF